MTEHYQHLGAFSDWIAAAHRQQTQALIRECLGFCHADENPMDVKIERE